jgi:hypothetical protein
MVGITGGKRGKEGRESANKPIKRVDSVERPFIGRIKG